MSAGLPAPSHDLDQLVERVTALYEHAYAVDDRAYPDESDRATEAWGDAAAELDARVRAVLLPIAGRLLDGIESGDPEAVAAAVIALGAFPACVRRMLAAAWRPCPDLDCDECRGIFRAVARENFAFLHIDRIAAIEAVRWKL